MKGEQLKIGDVVDVPGHGDQTVASVMPSNVDPRYLFRVHGDDESAPPSEVWARHSDLFVEEPDDPAGNAAGDDGEDELDDNGDDTDA